MWELLDARMGGLVAVAAGAAAGFAVLELGAFALGRLRRSRAATSAPRPSLRTDLDYLLLSPVSEAFSRILATLAIAVCALLAGRGLGPELLRGFGPVVEQPRWLVVAEVLLLGDFLYYWAHRLAHTAPWLWRFHAVHHSTRHMRWTSAFRAHPAEAYVHLVSTLPLFVLGFPIDTLAAIAPIASLYALLIHSNVDVSVRPLSYVLNSPVYHRWHHALDAKNGDTNFAGFFPFFDAIFGTYHLPEHLPRALGIDDPDMPDTCLAQLAYPFRRRRLSSAHEKGIVMLHDDRGACNTWNTWEAWDDVAQS